MDCQLIQPELVAFHFGDLDDEARLRVETHLTACRACVAAFLQFKRAMETSDERPSAAAAKRLRDAVAQELDRAARSRRWSWWQRPLAATLAAAAVLLALSTLRAVASSPPGDPPSWARPGTR
jgi:anti-sigma factor RsiW